MFLFFFLSFVYGARNLRRRKRVQKSENARPTGSCIRRGFNENCKSVGRLRLHRAVKAENVARCVYICAVYMYENKDFVVFEVHTRERGWLILFIACIRIRTEMRGEKSVFLLIYLVFVVCVRETVFSWPDMVGRVFKPIMCSLNVHSNLYIQAMVMHE